MEYIAFISYRHLQPDASIAEKLARDIEQFVIPKSLRKNGRKRLGKVFRDKEELPLCSNLQDSLYHALDESEYLILICSPELLESRYCMEELRYFLTGHSADRVLTVLVRGTPAQSFPPVLLEQTDPETGAVRSVEPLAADASGPTLRAQLKKLKTEKFRILASCIGCRYDDLVQRSRRRKRKKAALTAAAVGAAALVFALALTSVIRARNEEQRSRMQADAQLLISSSGQLADEGKRQEAVLKALEAIALQQQGNFSLDGQEYLALARAASVYETDDTVVPDQTIAFDQIVREVTLTPDGKYLLISGENGKRVRFEIRTGETEEGDFSGYYTPDGQYRITLADGTLQVTRTGDGSVLYTYGDGIERFIADEDAENLLIIREGSYELRRLATGEKLAEAARDKEYTAEGMAVTGDGKAAAVLLTGRKSWETAMLTDHAFIRILTGSAASMTYELPDAGKGTLFSAGGSLMFACPTGLYLLDPEGSRGDLPSGEAHLLTPLNDYTYDLSQFYAKVGKRAVLVFGPHSLTVFDRETGKLIDSGVFDDYSPVISCSWMNEAETHAVFVTSSGACYHYFDEYENTAAAKPADPFFYDGGNSSGVVRQQPLLFPPDQAYSGRDGTGIFLAAVTREDRQKIQLYRQYQNPRAEYLSHNLPRRDTLRIDRIPGGHLLRFDRMDPDISYYTLLEFTGGKYTEHAFSASEPILGISADLKTAYSRYGALDLETGHYTNIVTAELKQKLQDKGVWCLYTAEQPDSRNNQLRMLVSEKNGAISVIAFKNEQMLWEDVFPCEGTAIPEEGEYETAFGKNGWASTPVMKADGSFVWVLTDLYNHQFTVIPAPDYRNGAMGKDPENPVFAERNGDRLWVIDCRTGEKTDDLPLPANADNIKEFELLNNDRAVFLVQRDLTVSVMDRTDGAVLYSRHVPFDGVFYADMILHLYEGNGEFCYTFRNEGLALMYAEEHMGKIGYYTPGYNIDMSTWQEKWIAPRLNSVQYDAQRMVVYDSTYTKCYSLPILTMDELVQVAQSQIQ